MPQKFTARNSIINAMQLTTDNIEEVERWCQGAIKGTKLPVHEKHIDIQTLNGEVTAEIGDYVCVGYGREGQYWGVLSPDEFHDIFVETN